MDSPDIQNHLRVITSKLESISSNLGCGGTILLLELGFIAYYLGCLLMAVTKHWSQ